MDESMHDAIPQQRGLYWGWKLFVMLPSAVVVFMLYSSGFADQEFFVFSDDREVGNRLDAMGFDHDSKAALIAARKATKHSKMSLHTETPYVALKSEQSCVVGDERRSELPESLQEPLNFTTSVHTNFNFLFMGDFSIMQMSEAFQESAGVDMYDRLVLQERKVDHHSVNTVHIGATADYGVAAGYFVEKMFQPAVEMLDNEHAVEWDQDAIQPLMNFTMPWLEPLGSFDILVVKPPQTKALDSLKQITEDVLGEFIQQASESFGASAVIFVTLPLHEDYTSVEDLLELEATNNRIRMFADTFHGSKGPSSSVKTVLSLDFASLVSEVVSENARQMGMNVTVGDYSYLMERFSDGSSKPAVVQVCAEPKQVGFRHDKCKLNMFALDGVNWCMETLGGRIVAGLSCLSSCVGAIDRRRRLACETMCNKQFMSLAPINERRFTIGP